MNLRCSGLNLSHHVLLALVCSLLASVSRADDWAPNLTALAGWNSNVSHATASVDQIDSLQVTADILATQRYEFGPHDSLHLRGHLAGEWWPRYRALLTGAAGARGEWQHKFGVSTRSVIVGLEGSVDAVTARESGRHGYNTAVNASVRKRLNDLTRIALRHEVAWFDARYGTYDSGASETSFEIDRDLNDVSRLRFTARYRDGDVVSYASGFRPNLEALAPQRLPVSTFKRPMTAYRIDAQTWSARLAFVRALDESSAIVIAYERRETERSSFQFREHVLSIGFVQQF